MYRHCARWLTYLFLISSSKQHSEVNIVMTFILQMRGLRLRKSMNLMKVAQTGQWETQSVVSHSLSPCFTIGTQPPFSSPYLGMLWAPLLGLSAMIRVVCYLTKKTKIREIQREWREREKRKGEGREFC